MSKIEEILKANKTDSKLANFVKTVDIIKVAEETTLAFTKWKDDNYVGVKINLYVKVEIYVTANRLTQRQYEDTFKTREQLFDEWNNLKTT